ncbi:MAG TPA: CBS domain-containing protein [Gaiellaceae bacterium]|jgi:CBS domain-containing protein|nr:CBS domain-containing protein [Gaiellaceae bacterium]
MAISDVMRVRVVAVAPTDTAHVAVLRMLEEDVGAVAVCEEGRVVGIFTERDVLRLGGEHTDLEQVRVGDVMTTEVVSVNPDVSVTDAAELMGSRRIRHLPVVLDGNLLGMVGIRDVLACLVERLWHAHDEAAHDTARALFRR